MRRGGVDCTRTISINVEVAFLGPVLDGFPSKTKRTKASTMSTDQEQVDIPMSKTEAAPTSKGWSGTLVTRLIIMILTAEIGFMVFTFPANALVQIGAEFQTNQVAWLQTAFALTASVTAMIIGSMADRFGKRRVILVVLTIALAGLLISAFAPAFVFIIIGRILQSATLALPFLLPSLVRDVYPLKTIPTAIALVSSGAGLLSIGVSLSAGYVIDNFGFRAVFWMPAIFVAIMLVVIRAALPESSVRSEKTPVDFLGAALFGIGLAGVLLGISLGSTSGWASTSTLLTIGIGILLIIAWVIQSFRTRVPLINLREFRHFPFLVTFLFSLLGTSSTIWFFVINTTVALNPTSDGWGLGMTPEQASIFAALFTLGSFCGGIAAGPILARIPAPIVAAFVQTFLVLGFTIALFGLANSTIFAVAAFVIGISGGANYSLIYNLVVLVVDAHKQATMAALITVGANVGGAILPVAIFAYMNSNTVLVGGVPNYTLESLQFAMVLPASLGVILIAFSIALQIKRRGTALQAGTRK
jgi:MFS family permease